MLEVVQKYEMKSQVRLRKKRKRRGRGAAKAGALRTRDIGRRTSGWVTIGGVGCIAIGGRGWIRVGVAQAQNMERNSKSSAFSCRSCVSSTAVIKFNNSISGACISVSIWFRRRIGKCFSYRILGRLVFGWPSCKEENQRKRE